MRRERALLVGLGACCAALLLGALYRLGPTASIFPGCLFHRLTGLNCPGCGMTRASYAALHGRWAEAFRDNPLGMILMPAALLATGLGLAGWVRGKPLLPGFRIGACWAWVLFGVYVAFWVLRNIPLWPCTLLSPP